MRDADELHEALCGLSLMPADASSLRRCSSSLWPPTAPRCVRRDFWVPAERLELVRRAYPQAAFHPAITAPAATRAVPESPERCAAEILRGWFECSGPLRAADLSATLAMPRDLVDQALAQLEAEGQILRGSFSPAERTEWCHRRLLARIHRLTIGRLRREIEPVTTAEFYAFLDRWQHAAPGTQLHGVDGTLQIIRQLQGCEFAAAAWETDRAAAPRGALQARISGPALPFGRSQLGPPLAAPRLRARAGREQEPPRAAHARRAAGHLSARRCAVAAGHAAALAQGFALAPGARSAGRHRIARRVFLRRPDARHRPPGQRSGRRALGTGGRRPGDRRRFRKSARAARSQAPPRRRQGPHRPPAPRARPMGAAASHRQSRPMAMPKRSRASCWLAGAWCSAMSPPASRSPPPGAICWWCCAAWNRAAKSAAAVSSPPSSASSSPCRKRWTCCAPSAAPGDGGEQFALPEALDLLRAIRRSGEVADPATCDTLPWVAPAQPAATA